MWCRQTGGIEGKVGPTPARTHDGAHPVHAGDASSHTGAAVHFHIADARAPLSDTEQMKRVQCAMVGAEREWKNETRQGVEPGVATPETECCPSRFASQCPGAKQMEQSGSPNMPCQMLAAAKYHAALAVARALECLCGRAAVSLRASGWWGRLGLRHRETQRLREGIWGGVKLGWVPRHKRGHTRGGSRGERGMRVVEQRGVELGVLWVVDCCHVVDVEGGGVEGVVKGRVVQVRCGGGGVGGRRTGTWDLHRRFWRVYLYSSTNKQICAKKKTRSKRVRGMKT
ncbi:hypothetical protein K438DRAFT_234643 [Mycena galopus ATCC 62051]|nr:hypothetical protein K438DRAFT_234643 [Mycena galopus ATCC 62051]